MRPSDQRDDLSRALGRLPQLRAPETLLPRVMVAVRAWAMRPWYQRAWFTWPVGWQIATVATLVAMVTLVWQWVPQLPLPTLTGRWNAPVAALGGDSPSRLSAVRLTAGVFLRAMQPVLFYAFVIVIAMTTACLAAAMALNRAVFGRTPHP